MKVWDFLKTANIIDIGGGDSNLVDVLLENGYENIWVFKISEFALEKAKLRLGEKADKVHWIVSDITEFSIDSQFDFWHDRAFFQFLTNEENIDKYVALINNAVADSGNFFLGTFTENTMKQTFKEAFEAVKCFKKIILHLSIPFKIFSFAVLKRNNLLTTK